MKLQFFALVLVSFTGVLSLALPAERSSETIYTCEDGTFSNTPAYCSNRGSGSVVTNRVPNRLVAYCGQLQAVGDSKTDFILITKFRSAGEETKKYYFIKYALKHSQQEFADKIVAAEQMQKSQPNLKVCLNAEDPAGDSLVIEAWNVVVSMDYKDMSLDVL